MSLNPKTEGAESEEELLDTEDEYEGIPELTLDLEGEMSLPGGLKAPLR